MPMEAISAARRSLPSSIEILFPTGSLGPLSDFAIPRLGGKRESGEFLAGIWVVLGVISPHNHFLAISHSALTFWLTMRATESLFLSRLLSWEACLHKTDFMHRKRDANDLNTKKLLTCPWQIGANFWMAGHLSCLCFPCIKQNLIQVSNSANAKLKFGRLCLPRLCSKHLAQ